MTTTPDPRIRGDWTLPADIAAPPPSPDPIDTSTTAGRVAVMQAYLRDWRSIECLDKHVIGDKWEPVQGESPAIVGEPAWDWRGFDYRIAPPPAQRSALQAARDYDRKVPPIGGRPDDKLRDLLKQIDSSIVVTIEHFKFPHYGATKPEDLLPGRYRLLRDDV